MNEDDIITLHVYRYLNTDVSGSLALFKIVHPPLLAQIYPHGHSGKDCVKSNSEILLA